MLLGCSILTSSWTLAIFGCSISICIFPSTVWGLKKKNLFEYCIPVSQMKEFKIIRTMHFELLRLLNNCSGNTEMKFGIFFYSAVLHFGYFFKFGTL